MAKIEMIESHLETLLERITENERLGRDESGAWAFDVTGGSIYVHLRNEQPARVEVRGHIEAVLAPSVRLMLDVIDLNARSLYSRVCLYEGRHVVVECDLVATDLDRAELEVAMDAVRSTMTRIDGDYVIEWLAAEELDVD